MGAPYIYDISSLRVNDLTLILLTWRKWWAPNNASKQQMGFNSAFKGLNAESSLTRLKLLEVQFTFQSYCLTSTLKHVADSANRRAALSIRRLGLWNTFQNCTYASWVKNLKLICWLRSNLRPLKITRVSLQCLGETGTISGVEWTVQRAEYRPQRCAFYDRDSIQPNRALVFSTKLLVY